MSGEWLRGRLAPTSFDKTLALDLSIVEAKNKVRAFKGQFTLDLAGATRAITFAEANPSPQAVFELKTQLDHLRYHKEWIEVLNIFLGFKEPGSVATHEASTSEVITRYED